MDELQEYFNNILAHLDAMAKRTIFMMGVEYGKQKSREQESNFSGGFSTEEKTETMLINLSGVSINSKPRADGRYQGYAMRDGEKKYFYGKTPEEVRDKIQKYLKSAPAPNQTKIFLQFVEGRSLSLLFRFLLATGLRIGEALALTPNDIDDEERTVKVNKNIVFLENGEVLTQRPKTQAAVRTVPLADSLYMELCSIKTDRSFPYTYNYVRKFISGISKRVGFPVTVHTLRHTYADRLEEAGIPPKIKQYLLGHADLDTTQNVYTDTQAHYIQAFLPQIRGIFDTK